MGVAGAGFAETVLALSLVEAAFLALGVFVAGLDFVVFAPFTTPWLNFELELALLMAAEVLALATG